MVGEYGEITSVRSQYQSLSFAQFLGGGKGSYMKDITFSVVTFVVPVLKRQKVLTLSNSK